MINFVFTMIIIILSFIGLFLFLYNYKKFGFKFIYLLINDKCVILFRIIIVLIVFIVIAFNYNSYILNKKFNSLDSAIKATKPEKVVLIVDDNNLKLYAETDKNNHTYLVEYKKENKYWKINNNYLTNIQGKTRYKITNANVLYYTYVIPFEINDKLVVYIKCVEGKFDTDYCKNVVIEDNYKNIFTFDNDNYDFKVLNGIKKEDYYYIFDNIKYDL